MIDMKKIKFKEGIDGDKFIINFCQENSAKVLELFEKYNYDLELDGKSAKIFSIPVKSRINDKNNEPELTVDELAKSLEEVDKLNLKEIFNINLSCDIFKEGFIERIKFYLNNNLPFLNPDNTFVSELHDAEKFGIYRASISLQNVKTAQEKLNEYFESNFDKMDPEDKQVYNEIVSRLSFLVLGNPTDEFLNKVVQNVEEKIIDAILRKEYKFSSLNDMINNVMFDGLDVTPVDSVRIEELILNTFPEEERKLS